MILRTEAVVLRSIPYSETSQIATLFTREKGKLSVMAKGSRRPKSRFGSTLQVFSVVQAVVYYRATRTLHTLSECSHSLVMQLDDLAQLTTAYRMVELTQALTQSEEQNPELFDLLVTLLARLQQPHASTMLLGLYYEMQLACALGFDPSFDREAVRSLPKDGGTLHLDDGKIESGLAQSATSVRGSWAALRAFAILSRAELDVIVQMTTPALDEVTELVTRYVRHHVAEAYPDRAQKVIKAIL